MYEGRIGPVFAVGAFVGWGSEMDELVDEVEVGFDLGGVELVVGGEVCGEEAVESVEVLEYDCWFDVCAGDAGQPELVFDQIAAAERVLRVGVLARV